MPTPLTGGLGRELINFLKRSSASRKSSTGDPVKKSIILAKQKGASGAHVVSNTGSISVTMALKGKSSQIHKDVTSRMHSPNLKGLIFQP